MKALLIVDVQRDFMPGGALAVSGANDIIPVINTLQQEFDQVIASHDWHPSQHGCFADNHPGHRVGDVIDLAGVPQILWPRHCVQHSEGALPAEGLMTDSWQACITKGTDPLVDSYSAFFDNAHNRHTKLHQHLQTHHIQHLYLVGVATDYCVQFTALDARALGYRVSLYTEACRAVNLNPQDGEAALVNMAQHGVELI